MMSRTNYNNFILGIIVSLLSACGGEYDPLNCVETEPDAGDGPDTYALDADGWPLKNGEMYAFGGSSTQDGFLAGEIFNIALAQTGNLNHANQACYNVFKMQIAKAGMDKVERGWAKCDKLLDNFSKNRSFLDAAINDSKYGAKESMADGYYEWCYDNGNTMHRFTSKNGKYDGLREEFFPDGKLKTRSHYADADFDGLAEVFWENGNPKSVKEYAAGDLVSQKYYHENGQLESSTDADGNRIGYFENGNLQSKGQYGLEAEGRRETYFENGQLRQVDEVSGGKGNGERLRYYPDGTVREAGDFADGEKVGVHKAYYSNGQLQYEINYLSGGVREDGQYVEYFADGSIRSTGAIVNGLNDGYWVRSFPAFVFNVKALSGSIGGNTSITLESELPSAIQRNANATISAGPTPIGKVTYIARDRLSFDTSERFSNVRDLASTADLKVMFLDKDRHDSWNLKQNFDSDIILPDALPNSFVTIGACFSAGEMQRNFAREGSCR